MRERFPVTTRGAETTTAAMVGSVLDLHGLGCRAHPAAATADEPEMQVPVASPNLAFPLLPVQVHVRGGGDLGIELRRRQALRLPADLRAPSLWATRRALETIAAA